MTQKKTTEYGYVESRGLYRKKIKDSAGKYVQITARTPERLAEKIAEYQQNTALSKTGKKNQLFCDYAQAWLDLHSSTIGYGTRVSYQSLLDAIIFPALKGRRMLDIKPKDIQTVIASISDKSYSINKNALLILNQIFSFACDNKDVLKNPCEKIAPGGIPQKSRTALTDEQVDVLLVAVKGLKAYPFCMIGLYAGLRTEEILGLKWDCVHLADVPYIEVKRALRFKGNKSTLSDTLKTTASHRNMPIPAPLLQALTEAKATSQHEFLFSSKSGGPYSKIQFRELWQIVNRRRVGKHTYLRPVDGKLARFEYMGEMGEKSRHGRNDYCIYFKVTPHILRHTYISDLIAGGVDIKTVQYLAGHETSKTTLDIYTHLTYHNADKILAKVNRAFPDTAKRE